MGNKPPMPNDRMRNVIKTYSLSKSEQKRLWKLFKTIDRDGSGEIDVNEFMKWLVEPVNSFTKGIFRLIDTDQSNTLDFFEFCDALCTFATFNEVDVLKFCFALFDDDKNGFIEKDELDFLLECLHDGNYAAKIEEVLLNIDVDRDQRIDFDEFNELNINYPFLLFPAYKFQQAIIRETFGEQKWERKNVKATRQRNRERRKQAHTCRKHLRKARINKWKMMLSDKNVGVLGLLEHEASTQIRSLLHLKQPEPSIQCLSDTGWGHERLAGANFRFVEKRRAEEHLRAFDTPDGNEDDEARGSDGADAPDAKHGIKNANGRKRRKKKRRGGAQVVPADEREASGASAQPAQAEEAAADKEDQQHEQQPQSPRPSKRPPEAKGGRRYSIET